MVEVFRRKIARRSDGKLRCLLGELPAVLAAGSSCSGSGGGPLPQPYDLVLSHMTFHHLPDIAGKRTRGAVLQPLSSICRCRRRCRA